MAGMAREELIEYGEDYFKDLTAACCKISEKHKAFVKTAISDMERVEQLEAENKRLKEDLSRWQEGEWNNCEECCNRLAYKLAELRDGIEKAKAEIDNSRTISLTYNTALDDCLSIINKHLGE